MDHPRNDTDETRSSMLTLLGEQQEGSVALSSPSSLLGGDDEEEQPQSSSSLSSANRQGEQVRLAVAAATDVEDTNDNDYNDEGAIPPPHVVAIMKEASRSAEGLVIVSGITYAAGWVYLFFLDRRYGRIDFSSWSASPSSDFLLVAWLGGSLVSCMMMAFLLERLKQLHREMEAFRELLRSLWILGGGGSLRATLLRLRQHPLQYCCSCFRLLRSIEDFSKLRKGIHDDLNDLWQGILVKFCCSCGCGCGSGCYGGGPGKKQDATYCQINDGDDEEPTSGINASTAALLCNDEDNKEEDRRPPPPLPDVDSNSLNSTTIATTEKELHLSMEIEIV